MHNFKRLFLLLVIYYFMLSLSFINFSSAQELEIKVTTEPVPGVPLKPGKIVPIESETATQKKDIGDRTASAKDESSINWEIDADLPNLIVDFTPPGWDYPIVPSSVPGTHTVGPNLYGEMTTYIDLAFANREADIPSGNTFYIYLYNDGTLLQGWYWNGMPQNYYGPIEDFDYIFSEGDHTLKTYVDARDAITESNENDNEYQRTFNWQAPPAIPDIKIYPEYLIIEENQGSSQFQDLITVNESCNNHPGTSSNEYTTGLIIPEDVAKYCRTHKKISKYNVSDFEPSIDWSVDDSPVKNQGNCSACWAFAVVALIENLSGMSDLSEQTVISCTPSIGNIANDCTGGWHGYALEYIHENGVPEESCYEYTAKNGDCAKKCPNPSILIKVNLYDKYPRWEEPTASTINDLKDYLQVVPVVVGMFVPDDGTFYDYTGGIYNYEGDSISTSCSHTVLVVGYDDAQQYFKVKNSWGPNWGENGYFRISYDDVTDDVHFGRYACIAGEIDTIVSKDNISIANTGFGTLDVANISSDQSWLTVDPTVPPLMSISPGNSMMINCLVDWNLLMFPSEQATLTIASNDPDESTKFVTVIAYPSQQHQPPEADFTGAPVSGTAPLTVLFTDNSSGDISDWSWNFPGGNPSSSTEQGPLQVIYNTPGQYNVSLSVSGPGGTDTETINNYITVSGGTVHFNPVSPTGEFQSVVIQNATISGTIIERGDEIAVFDGTLCVGAGIFSDVFPFDISVWMETEQPGGTILPGATAGNPMSFKIWKSSADTEFAASPTYSTGNGTLGEPLTVVELLDAVTTVTQTIPIKHSQFNMISFNVQPPNLAMDVLLADFENLLVAQDDQGNFYVPAYGINLIGDVDLTNGYQVYITGSANDQVNAEGFPLDPAQFSQTLTNNRLYMINYPYQVPYPIENVFAEIVSKIVVVQDDEGNFWVPLYFVNTIGNMQPGKGYQIYVNESVNFTYPELEEIPAKQRNAPAISLPQPVHFKYQKSGLPYAIVVTGTDMKLEKGDEIGVFDGSQCVGAAVFTGKYPVSVAAWEGNAERQLPGFTPGNPISFRFWNAACSKEYVLESHFANQTHANFRGGALSAATLTQPAQQAILPESFVLNQNYPNPFNPQTIISYQLPTTAKVSLIIYNMQGKLIRRLVNVTQEQGIYKVAWDGKDENGQPVGSGVYYYQLRSEKFTEAKKLILIK